MSVFLCVCVLASGFLLLFFSRFFRGLSLLFFRYPSFPPLATRFLLLLPASSSPFCLSLLLSCRLQGCQRECSRSVFMLQLSPCEVRSSSTWTGDWTRRLQVASESLCSPPPHSNPLVAAPHSTMLSRSLLRTTTRRIPRASTSSVRAYTSETGPSFGLNEEQQAFQDLARSFTANEIIPVAAEYDRTMKVSYRYFAYAGLNSLGGGGRGDSDTLNPLSGV